MVTKDETKVCARCGRTEEKILKDFDEASSRGVIIIGSDEALLYCDHCEKYFCGRCQVDLGMSSGCPICRRALD